MRCPSLMLVNSVEVRDSLLYILGGSPEWMSVPAEGAQLGIALALTLEVAPGDLDAERHLTLVVEDDDGEVGRGAIGIQPVRRDRETFVAGAPLLLNMWASVDAEIRRMGGHSLRLLEGADELAHVRFGVRLAT